MSKSLEFQYLTWIRKQIGVARYPLLYSGIDIPPASLFSLHPKDASLTGEYEKPLHLAISKTFGIEENACFPTTGTTAGVFIALSSLLSPGDIVAVETPTYELLHAVPKALGARVLRFNRPVENGFTLDWNSISEVLQKRPKVLVLANPHNPSGTLLAPQDMARLVSQCHEVGTNVLVDEVYLPFATEYQSAYHLGAITVGSPTKLTGLGILRIGWVFAPPALLTPIKHAADISGHYVSLPAAKLFTRALAQWDDFVTRGLKAAKSREKVQEFVQNTHEVEWVTPDAGIIAFLRIKNLSDVAPFVQYALKEYSVSVVPGKFFEEPSGFRLGFGMDSTALEKGLAQLKKAIQSFCD